MRAKKKSDRKLEIRAEAKRKFGGHDRSIRALAQRRDDIEKGLSVLRRTTSEGGDSRAKKVKNELTYLINNYVPEYDARIQQLMDLWRRSGDPSYDPNIRLKLRRARQEHMTNSNPL